MSARNFKKNSFKITAGLIVLCFFVFLFLPLTEVSALSLGGYGTSKAGMAPMDEATFMAEVSLIPPSHSPEPISAGAAGAAKETLEKTQEHVIGPLIQAAIASAAFSTITYGFDQLAYYAAVWLASGASGEEPLVGEQAGWDAWKSLGNDILGEMVGNISDEFSDYFDINLNLCQPSLPIRLSLQLGITGIYQPSRPSCDWQDITKNWSGFWQGLQETAENPGDAALNALAKSFTPGQNTLSYLIIANNKILETTEVKKGSMYADLMAKMGFKDYVDPVTGQVRTPAAYVQSEVRNKLEASDEVRKSLLIDTMRDPQIWSILGLRTASVFIDTLISQVFQRYISPGLLPDITIDTNPFDESVSSEGNRKSAEDVYTGLFSTTKVGLDDYNVLTEFVSCPTSAGSVRQLNNCVMDASLLQAVAYGGSSKAMTVAEAIEEGYLHGDWPLYPPSDLSHNQDSLCYTYGYCYGNLVKLRKARIIPIGWEIAAASEENSSNAPITLQEAVDGFNDCNSDNGLDTDHPWCHLIDPNWILKYPSQQCLASMIGEQTLSLTTMAIRSAACVDAPSCVAEDEEGNCQGYGYCVREKNSWDFGGDGCPEEYATCLSFDNTDTSESGTWLFNTLDEAVCSADNAGCLWYRSNKYFDDAGTTDDDSDDEYAWLPDGDYYITADFEDDPMSYTSGAISARDIDTDLYSFEDRIYLTADAEECSEDSAGCSELYPVGEDLSLNIIRNSGFEDDDDADDEADYWSVSGSTYDYDEEGSNSYQGTDSYFLDSGDALSQNNLPLQSNRFYTLSVYAKGADSSAEAVVSLDLAASDNSAVDLTGYSVQGCTVTGSEVSLSLSSIDTSDFERFDCTFTAPSLDDDRLYLIADLTIDGTAGVFIDAIQLEVGENASDFHEGYSDDEPITEYLQVPPFWLGCEGEETDPDDCDDYAQVCSTVDAGCSLYTPVDGDPAVPAVLSDEDECPEECAGYAAYKQEATDYDPEEFPLYFIAETAEACGSADIGCDEFTNLETEETEAYSYLRACVTPEIDSGSVYFTWEGSDMTGYQLVSYQLLESDLSDSGTLTFDGSGGSESNIGQAPCVNWQMSDEDTLGCDDDSGAIAATEACDTHADILTEPDCREFYDSEGYIHYRLYSDTISISDDCAAYRKTETNENDCDASGGYWTTAGECRYLLESNESESCSIESAGCREYTGGSSRNASTILEELFESGTYENYEEFETNAVSLSISNESVAVDGHSLRVVADDEGDGFVTLHDFYAADRTTVCDSDTDSEACADTNSVNGLCTVSDDKESCGALVDQLVAGKTYILKFWAKGNGEIGAAFLEDGGFDYDEDGVLHDFVSPSNTDISHLEELATVELSSGWELYELGPIDTSDAATFDDDAVLGFFAIDGGADFYIDNIQLVQTEEDLTVIKDSWVTPSTCDQTPDGADSDQYYLGCEEYEDQNEETFYIYQFSDLCSEDVVGCEAFYDTHGSASPYTEAYNLTCYNDYDNDDDGEFDSVSSSTACYMDSEEVCTITTGYNYCHFDHNGNLPVPLPDNIELGPSAVIVLADEVKYLVSSDDYFCAEDDEGCVELGEPTFSNDRTVVESFESIYLLNQPDEYDDTLCASEELFCAEWSSTQDGNFYFKDPGDQECEYKTGVSLDSVSYDGWFRNGTTEFCYGAGGCSENEDTACETDADCAAAGVGECEIDDGDYIIGGDYSGIWLDGDDDYAGWAGVCGSAYDLCSEFIDPLDTKEGENPDGVSYFYLDNEAIDDEQLLSSERCDGLVSLEQGCALFFDTMDNDLTYAASPSYIASEHADLFFGEEPRSTQVPLSCPDDGELSTTAGGTIDLCASRCAYEVDNDYEIENLTVVRGPDIPTASPTDILFFGGSCVDDNDCQIGLDSVGNEVEGECLTLSSATTYGDETLDFSSYLFENDTNRIIKVDRDRQCAEWLACSSSHAAWDDRENSWVDVCEEINLCDEYDSSASEGGVCSSRTESEPIVLDAERYAGRDVSWYGLDYAGYAIPDQLPVEFYEQVDLADEGFCTNLAGEIETTEAGTAIIMSCADDDDCNSAYAPFCTEFDDLSESDISDYNLPDNDSLAYVAGSCDEDYGDTCTVGYCVASGDSCSDNDDCAGSDECAVGSCVTFNYEANCSSDSDCADEVYGSYTFTACNGGVCAYEQNINCLTESDCTDISGGNVSTECVPSALAYTGACYNDLCLVGLDGAPFDPDESEEMACRGYPESMSPFPSQVVEHWINPAYMEEGVDTAELLTAGDSGFAADAKPYDYVSGFIDANVCSVVDVKVNDDCLCSYEKVTYGESAAFRYYAPDVEDDDVLDGVCVGGEVPGRQCDDNLDCNPGEDSDSGSGVCQTLTKREDVNGWDGYCLEHDSSLQLFGSSSQDDRPCLTWLPVDQLRGSRDAYANETEAGFSGENYYCAEMDMAYDIKTTDWACAESYGACDGTNGWSGFEDTISDGSCIGSVTCPDGYFAIMTGCEELNYDEDSGEESQICFSGDDDCPFFCVPIGSYKTESDNFGDEGDPCLAPTATTLTGDDEPIDTPNISPFGTDGWISSGRSRDISAGAGNTGVSLATDQNFRIYLVYDVDPQETGWTFQNGIVDYYDDCAVRGITDNIDEYLAPYYNDEDGTIDFDANFSGSQGYYGNLTLRIGAYPACVSVVQVAQSEADSDGDYNQAWTDRVWPSKPTLYSLEGDASNYFGYTAATLQTIFGQATDPADMNAASDPYPHHIVACTDDGEQDPSQPISSIPETITVANTDDECLLSSLSVNNAEGLDARPFTTITVSEDSEDGFIEEGDTNSEYCVDSDCSCSDDADCNNGVTCSASVCSGGPLDGNGCDDDADCYGITCDVEHYYEEYDSSTYHCFYSTTLGSRLDTGDYEDALALLKQIFAKSYGLYGFIDGYSGISDSDPEEEWITLGSFEEEEVESDSLWDWNDVTPFGDSNTDGLPSAPTIASVGLCYGSECLEDEEGKFSVNGEDDETLTGSGGTYHATVNFFAWADSNQMPLRNIIVNWGDGHREAPYEDYAWPADSYSGSIATTNYYKNHRGLEDDNDYNCGDDDEWGLTSDACETAYFSFEHDYYCSSYMAGGDDLEPTLPDCEYADDTGRLQNSPCTGGEVPDANDKCVFQPRVHVKDNWGWCTGYCTSGSADSENEGCYDGGTGDDECNTEDCPSEGVSGDCLDLDGNINNPWINYDGVIVVDWAD